MCVSILKHVAALGALVLIVAGAGSLGAFVALVLDAITMDQVSGVLQQGVDDVHYYASGLGVASMLTAARAARPFIWAAACSVSKSALRCLGQAAVRAMEEAK